MIGPDPFGRDPLDDLQRRGLELREQLTRKWKNPLRNDDEPQTIAEAHWWVQPLWARIVTFAVGIPAFLYLKFGADTDPFSTTLGKISFGAFAFVALLQLFFVFRGYWRMNI